MSTKMNIFQKVIIAKIGNLKLKAQGLKLFLSLSFKAFPNSSKNLFTA
jgi:hypothetical protein